MIEDNILLKRPNKRRSSIRPAFVVVLLLVVVLGSGWWLWRGLYPAFPRFNFMLVSVNQELRNLLPGETISLHTSDQVRIVEVSTNVFLNSGIRLMAEGFDVNALENEETSLSGILPGRNLLAHYQFRVWVKLHNRNLGHVDWEVQPFAEDWLDKAKRTIKNEQKIEVLERGLKVLPEDSRIWRALLDEYKSQKLWSRAASMLEDAAKENPNQETLSELLEVYTAMASKAKVISVLGRLVQLDAKDTNLRLQLAKMLEDGKQNKEAIGQYEILAKQVGKNEKAYVYERLGFLNSETGNFKAAIACYLTAIRAGAKDANLYYNLSYLYEKIKDRKNAYAYLEKAADLNVKDVDSRLLLARRQIDQGDYNKAEKYLAEVLKKNPASNEAWLLTARIAEKKGDKKELIRIYEKLHSLDPKNDTVLYNLGVLYYEAGEWNQSLPYLEEFTRKNSKDEAAHEILFDTYRKLNDEKKAFKVARVLVALKPEKVGMYNFMFDYLNRQNKYREMVRVLEPGVKANPNKPELREQLLFAYLKTGKEDAALGQMRELIKLKPKELSLLLQMARLLENRGKLPEAMKIYEKVLTLSPDNEEAGAAYLRLRLEGVRSE